jgi:hypothetical protein
MAQNVAAPKSNVASQYSALAAALLKLIDQANELHSMYFAAGFNSGGSTPIAQGDLDIGTNTFMTPQVLTNVDAILVTLGTTFNATQLNQLRQAVITPVI